MFDFVRDIFANCEINEIEVVIDEMKSLVKQGEEIIKDWNEHHHYDEELDEWVYDED